MTIRAEAKRLEILQSKEGRKRRLKSKKVDIKFNLACKKIYIFKFLLQNFTDHIVRSFYLILTDNRCSR